jgi:hypothetical protein
VPQVQQASASGPIAVAAWHGSPTPDGNPNGNSNGTWYFQPAANPQQGEAAANGYTGNGMPMNGYVPPEQGSPQTASLNGGMAATQQYAQPGQGASGAGYQQGVSLPSTAAPRPEHGQPTQPGQVTQFGQVAQSAQTAQPPQTPPSADPAQSGSRAPAPQGAAPGSVTAASAAVPVGAAPAGSAPGPLTASAPQQAAPQQAAPQQAAAPSAGAPSAAEMQEAASATGPLSTLPTAPPAASPSPAGVTAGGPLSKLTGTVRGRRAARKPRLAMSAIFADLVDMADIPRSAYAVDEEVTGAMCLFKTDGGYEVFSCAEDARHEVRFFEEEEAAYFYLFGVLAAESLRNGRLTPRRG